MFHWFFDLGAEMSKKPDLRWRHSDRWALRCPSRRGTTQAGRARARGGEMRPGQGVMY
jgi:hypothetical protein